MPVHSAVFGYLATQVWELASVCSSRLTSTQGTHDLNYSCIETTKNNIKSFLYKRSALPSAGIKQVRLWDHVVVCIHFGGYETGPTNSQNRSVSHDFSWNPVGTSEHTTPELLRRERRATLYLFSKRICWKSEQINGPCKSKVLNSQTFGRGNTVFLFLINKFYLFINK